MSNLSELKLEEWHFRTDAALDWIDRSVQVTGGGSSHSRRLLLGWSKAYPETTGYLIETLLSYSRIKNNERWLRLAEDCLQWLLGVQLPSGAFPGLLAGNTRPSVFNTAQIMFGLMAGATETTLREASLKALKKAHLWMLEMLEADGAWSNHAYVPGFVPSYYTRAVWPVLRAGDLLQMPETEGLMKKALHFYAGRFLPNNAIRDWGFRSGEPAFTHTIAYTLEGFWECAIVLQETEIQNLTLSSMSRLLEERQKADGKTAGRFDEQWRGDLRFICATGNCQLSVLSRKMGKNTAEPSFIQASDQLLAEILPAQNTGRDPDFRGALPGSVPVWGRYLPMRYPNWGVKFFLDAMEGYYQDRFQ